MAVVPQPVDGGLDVPVLDIVFIDGLALEIVEWVEVKAPAPETFDLGVLQRNFNVDQNSLGTYAIHAVVRPRK